MGGKEKSSYQWWQQRGMRDELPDAKGAPHGCSGCVCSVATYGAALGVGLVLRAASSWVAESPAEVELSGGGG